MYYTWNPNGFRGTCLTDFKSLGEKFEHVEMAGYIWAQKEAYDLLEHF